MNIPKIVVSPAEWAIVHNILQRHVPGREVWAFGSRAKWTSKEFSDLDLAIIGDEPLSITTLASLSEDFSESELPYKVDIVDWATTSPSFRKVIEADKVVIQKGNQGCKIDFEWKSTTLGQVCNSQGGAIQTGPFGSQLHTSDYKELGVPVVMPTNIGDGGLVEDGIARIGEADVERLSQHKLRLGDIVFSRRGDVTKNALISVREVGWLCGTGCLKVRLGDESIANAKFISHYLRQPDTKEWLIRHAVGATMPNLNTGILSAVPVHLPPLQTQLEIAAMLDALDDKIALLRETNFTLEAIAQALFKSWFVDFDPVRAKAEGREPEGIPHEIADLFPSEFEESVKGEIPKEWGVVTFGDIVDVVGGGTPSTKKPEYWEGGTHYWATPKDLSGMDTPVLLDTERKITDEGLKKISSGLLPVGTLLMSSRAPIGYLAIAEVPVAINQGFIAMKPKASISNLYLLHLVRSQMDEIKSHSNGSTFMEISKSVFRPLRVIAPPASVIHAFDSIVRSLYKRLVENQRQIGSLTELRDTLLPRLMSGKLRISNAESLV